MGVRKHLGMQYFTCDWTAQPMDATYAQRPVFKQDESGEWKMAKTGAYICYEAALAHTRELELARLTEEVGQENIDPLDWEQKASQAFKKAVEWIANQTSADIKPAPHFNELIHFGGGFSVQDYLAKVTAQETPIQAVILKDSGPFETFIGPDTLSDTLYPKSFKAVRPRKDKKNKHSDLMVFYNDTKPAPKNTAASELFRQEITGDALLVLVCKEPSFMARQRLLHYGLADFNDDYYRKKRKSEAPNALTSDEYAAVKAEAQESIHAFESKISERAVKPETLAKAQKIPAASGKEIARLVEAQLMEPPPKKKKTHGKKQLEAALLSSAPSLSVSVAPPALVRTDSMPVAPMPPPVRRQPAQSNGAVSFGAEPPNLEAPFLPAGVA